MSSIEGLLITNPENEKAHKISFHRRNYSDELDVFEAARYFSGYNEAAPLKTTIKEERPSWRGGRLSLDTPIRTVLDQNVLHRHDDVDRKPTTKEKIKYNQPSSPGGKLASFLNSLFNQSGSKKKKPKPFQSRKDEEEEEVPSGVRRIRRSSISHFRSSSTTTSDAKSTYSSSSFGFRSPPSYVAQITTAKISEKDWTISHSDHKPVLTDLTKHNVTSHAKSQDSEMCKRNSEVVVDDDDDGDSDSSSDLFELENYDLPVYETTKVDSIKNIRVATIANAS